jgi:hypothetical protein
MAATAIALVTEQPMEEPAFVIVKIGVRPVMFSVRIKPPRDEVEEAQALHAALGQIKEKCPRESFHPATPLHTPNSYLYMAYDRSKLSA